MCEAKQKECVDDYMANGGPVCWAQLDITRNCGAYSGVKCDDCGVKFCQLSPMRPARTLINAKVHTLCAACMKPFSVHRAHWTYDTYWAIQKREREEQNHEAMHEFRAMYEANIARMADNEDSPF